MTRPAYPFTPKSNARLLPGEFWAIPLGAARYACGVVVGVPHVPDERLLAVNTRTFLGGLLEWEGSEPPTVRAIAGARLAGQGMVHIKTITETGGQILGRLEAPVRPLTWRSTALPGDPGWVYEGIERVRPATAADHALRLIQGWGYGYMRELASQASGRRSRD